MSAVSSKIFCSDILHPGIHVCETCGRDTCDRDTCGMDTCGRIHVVAVPSVVIRGVSCVKYTIMLLRDLVY